MRDPKLAAVFDVVDPLLPVMRLHMDMVKKAHASYKQQLQQQHDINRVFLHTEEVLIFFSPYDIDIVRPVISKLAERSPMGELLIPLTDVFTLLSMFVGGDVIDKGAFLFELFNLSKQDILSETEHALMIFRMSRCLEKIGILGRLDFTMDDVKHAAFLARYIENEDRFVPGLNVDELTDWLTNSYVGRAASSFATVFTRLLKVCIRMGDKASSLLAWLYEMRDHRKFDLPVPRMDFSKAILHKSDIFVVYRGCNMVSLCLSTALLAPEEVLVQCNLHKKFSKTSEKYYKLISYRKLQVQQWSRRHGQYARLDIAELDADAEYSFNVYQLVTNLRYSLVSTRTLTEKGLTSKFESFCELYITPSCLTPRGADDVMRLMKTSRQCTLIYTGNICSVSEPLRRAAAFAHLVGSSHMTVSNREDQSPLLPVPAKCDVASICAIIETQLTNDWLDGMRTLYGLTASPVSLHKDLSSICVFDKHLMTIPCGIGLLQNLVNSLPDSVSEVKQAVRDIYMSYARASVPPTSRINFGSKIIFNVSPSSCWSNVLNPAARILDLISFMEEDNLINESPITDIIILCESPQDILITAPRFPPQVAVTVTTNELPSEPLPEAADEPFVCRGKQELLYGAQYGGSGFTDPVGTGRIKVIQSTDGYTGTWFTYLVENMAKWRCEPRRDSSHFAGTSESTQSRSNTTKNSIQQPAVSPRNPHTAVTDRSRRAIHIISAGWQNGCNFSILTKSGTIASHHSLLRTKFSQSGVSQSGHKDCEVVLTSIKSMLPEGASIVIDFDETADRLISFTKNGLNFTSCISLTNSGLDQRGGDFPQSSIMRKVADFYARPPVTIIRGPRIVCLGSNFIEVCVAAVGFGVVTCKLYGVPMQANHDDISCLPSEEFKYLTLIGEINKKCLRQVNAVFRFTNLREYSAYCILAEPSTYGEKHLACFKTFGGSRDSVNSIMLCALPPRACFRNSIELAKLLKFTDRSERSAVSINVMEVELRDHDTLNAENAHNMYSSTTELPSADIRALEQRARVSVTFFNGFRHALAEAYLSRVKWNNAVDICVTDQFCKLTPRDSSVESCAYGMLDALLCVTCHPEISTIVIMSPGPFVPYLYRKDLNALWTADHSFPVSCGAAVFQMLNVIFSWKQDGLDGLSRDCVIFTVLDVKDVSVVRIMKVQRGNRPKNVRIQDGVVSKSLKRGSFGKKMLTRSNSGNDVKARKASSGGHGCIRNVILPARILGESDPVCHKFASGIQCMNDTLMYEVSHAVNADKSLHVLYPRTDIYGKDVLPSGEPIVYTLEVSSQNIGGSEHDTVSEYCHGVVVRMTVHELDNFRVTLGPVVGQVTDTSATIAIEMNSDLPQIRCQLLSSISKPFPNGELTPSFQLQDVASAGKVLRFDFTKLSPGLRYHVCFPDILPNQIIGSFQTQQATPRYAQLAFVGQNIMSINLPVISNLFDAAERYQLPNSGHSEVLNILSSAGSASNGAETWKYLKHYLIQLQCQTSGVLHIGSHALLAQAFSKAIKPLLDRIFNLQQVALGETLHEEVIEEQRYTEEGNPIRATTKVEKNAANLEEVVKTSFFVSYFTDEIQLLVKEIFRVLWNVPELQHVLCNGSQIPLFHNDYYTPFSHESLGKLSQDVNVDMLLQAANMIQDFVRKYSQGYVLHLREIGENRNMDFEKYDTHFYLWRKSSLAVLSLDIATGRTTDNFQENEFNKEQRYRAMMARKMEDISGASDSSYSPGFFDRKQWNNIKDALVDKFVTQMVICTQYPLVGLGKIPTENTFNRDDPTLVSIPFPWEPTETDLFSFFQMLIKWLDPKRSFGVSRTVIFISTGPVAFHTTIMDMLTGLLIHQICLPDMTQSGYARDVNSIRETAIMSGRIKQMKYFHRFHGMDNFRVDSSRLGTSRLSGAYDEFDPALNGPRSGFGLLRVWFDSWKAIGDWSLCHSFPGCLQEGFSSVLTLGPVIGMPYRVFSSASRRLTSMSQEQVMVPIMIEVDRATEVIIEVVNIFSCSAFTISSGMLRPYEPKVMQIGPLDIDSRYNCRFIKGVMYADDHKFVLQTSSHIEDTNVAVINVDLKEGTTHCSDFIFDLVNRCSLPFNGINAVVHTNVDINVNHIREEFVNLPSVWNYFRSLDNVQKAKELQAKRKEKKPTDELMIMLSETLKRIREEFRMFFSRPSYRELLKCSFNLFFPKCNIAELNSRRESTSYYSEANYMFDLMLERVRQEYFDQLSILPSQNSGGSIYRGTPKIILQTAVDNIEAAEEEEEEVEEVPSTIIEGGGSNTDGEVPAASEVNEQQAEGGSRADTPATPKTPKSSLFDTSGMPDEYVPLAETVALNKKIAEAKKVVNPFEDKVKDKSILHMAKARHPPVSYVTADTEPTEAVFMQWQNNILEPGVCALPARWLSLNKRLSIECIPPPNKDNSREVIEEYSVSDLDAGVRIIVLFGSSVEDIHSPGGLFDPEEKPARLYGLRIQRWTNLWLNQQTDRNVVIVCPSQADGNVSMHLTLDASPLKETERRLSAEMLGSVYISNQQEILNMQKEQQVNNKAKKPKQQGNLSRARLRAIEEAKKAQDARDLIELTKAFKTFTPDGYIFVECKHATIDNSPAKDAESQLMSKAEQRKAAKDGTKTVAGPEFVVEGRSWVRRISSLLGGAEEEARLVEAGDINRPGFTDFLQLPEWFIKWFPVNAGAFVQDEVPLMLRQDPIARSLIVKLEDKNIYAALLQIYESSRLSEFSRPLEQREVDMSLEGTTELLLREISLHIWKEVLSDDLRGHMSLFHDDFIRCVCLAHAVGSSDVDVAFRSGQAFASVLQRSLILCFQIFVAYKIHVLPQYAYLKGTPEFAVIESDSEPEDDDEDYMSEKDETEDKADEEEGGAIDGAPSLIKKQASSPQERVQETEPGSEALQEDTVLQLKSKRQKRNRFYGTKVSFLFVRQQK